MNKRVLVTGGTRGIGRAIAELLLRDGFAVEILAENEESLVAASEEMGGIPYHKVDLRSESEIDAFVTGWEGSLYGLVNNAGIFKAERIDSDDDVLTEVMAINFFAPYRLSKGLQSHFEDSGRIVNIASQLAFVARDGGCGPYGASKAALNMLTKNWARELGPRGVTVNSVCPNWTWTEMSEKDAARIAELEGLTEEEYLKSITEKLELRRFTTAKEVAEVVAFYLSEKASGVTGQTPMMNEPF